jgi:hypothetical protein
LNRYPGTQYRPTSNNNNNNISLHSIGKRGRNDSGEVRRLQNRLRALEQVNEALRAEMTILQQMSPPLLPPPAETNDKPSALGMSINTSHVCEKKLDKSTNMEVCNGSDNDHIAT